MCPVPGRAGVRTGQPGGRPDQGVVRFSNSSGASPAPVTARNGVAMTRNGGTPVPEPHGSVAGPGGRSVMEDVGDGDPIAGRCYDGDDDGPPGPGVDVPDRSGGRPVAY
ncbi:hypothetical protein ACH4KU_02415 [Streptomyces althioticus]|uniref:hypothetical protein n=1 Tax=Streptomyces TaxID=1883 RepID=UPI0036F77F64